MMRAKAPYKELDANIVGVCRALNRFRGVCTIGSCGGHRRPKSYQMPKGSWDVLFTVEHSEHGWHALEFLIWYVNNNLRRRGLKVSLDAYSPPPYLNEPGQSLYFAIYARGLDPDTFSEELTEYRQQFYLPPSRA